MAQQNTSSDLDLDSSTKLEPPSPSPPSPPSPASPPPNGGLLAWLQVAAGFVLFFNTWGLISAFSVFQTYYESGVLFAASSSEIAWIGALQSFLLQLMGLVAGPLYDRGYLRLLVATGGFLVVFGMMMLSLSRAYWQALLAQGVCVGLGAGLLFVPTVSLLPTWFSTRMGLAVGIASAGSSLGGIIYPLLLSRLLARTGFPWAVRSAAFLALATFVLPLVAVRMRVRVPRPRAVFDPAAFREPPFAVFTLAVLIVFLSNTVLLFYVSLYPTDRGFMGGNTALAFDTAALLNAGSFVGRILPNALSDRIGAFNTLAPLTLLLGISILCLLAVHSAAGMIVVSLVAGVFSGVVVPLPPVCFRMLTSDPSRIGTRLGQGFAVAGLGMLAGGPGAGAVLGSTQPLDWTGLWVYGGVSACGAGLLMAAVRVMRAGFAWNVKV